MNAHSDAADAAATLSASAEELLDHARDVFANIHVGVVLDGAAYREALRLAYEAARLDLASASEAKRNPDTRFLLFLGQVYWEGVDKQSALNCWLRAATYGDAQATLLLAQHHSEPERTLVYAALARQRTDKRPIEVTRNLLRLLATEPVISKLARRLFEESERWESDAAIRADQARFAIAASQFAVAEIILSRMEQRSEPVSELRAYLDQQRKGGAHV
jgi:hypothetical protein